MIDIISETLILITVFRTKLNRLLIWEISSLCPRRSFHRRQQPFIHFVVFILFRSKRFLLFSTRQCRRQISLFKCSLFPIFWYPGVGGYPRLPFWILSNTLTCIIITVNIKRKLNFFFKSRSSCLHVYLGSAFQGLPT